MFSDNNDFNADAIDETFDIDKFLDGDEAQDLGVSDGILSETEISENVLENDFSVEKEISDVDLGLNVDEEEEHRENDVLGEEIDDNSNVDDIGEDFDVPENIENEQLVDGEENLIDVSGDIFGDPAEQLSDVEMVSQNDETVDESEGDELAQEFTDDDTGSADTIKERDEEAKVSQYEVENTETYEDAVDADAEKTDSDEVGYVKWYSGCSSDPVFEIDKNSVSQAILGNDECQIIHINIGLSSYGWRIHFDNGVIMGIDDVREYQLRNGSLPSSNGTIIYSDNQIEFANINKITIYRSVRYFTYG